MGSREPRFGALTAGGKVLWRQVRSAPGAVSTIFVATLLAALFVTAVPRILERVSEEDLRESLAEAVPEQRNIRAESIEHIGASITGDVFAHVASRSEDIITSGFPPSVSSVVTETQYVVETPEFEVLSFPDARIGPFPTFFTFRHQQGVEERLTLVEGEMPESRDPIEMLLGGECPEDRLAVDGFEGSPDIDCQAASIKVFETVVSAETAEAMMLEIGDQALLRPTFQDQLWLPPRSVADHNYVLEVSGIVALRDITDEYWFADASLHRPRIRENPDFRFIHATGLMHPDDYDELLNETPARGLRYTWRLFVDPELVEGSRAADLAADVTRILPYAGETLITSLDQVIAQSLEQRALTVSLMSTAVAGLLVAAIGVVLVLAALIAERQAGPTVLIRDRGASRGQLGLTAVETGLLLVAPAAVLGYLLTSLALPGTDSSVPGGSAAALAVGGVAAVVVAGEPYVFRRLGALQRLDRVAERPKGRRVVFEVFMLVAAIASVALLRRRGLAEATGPNGDLDLLLAVAPAVIGVTAGLVVLRLLAPLMRSLSWLGARRRDAVAFIGFRRLGAQPGAGRSPTVVIVLAVAVAVFSSVVSQAIADGQERHTWQVVGGDFRIDGGRDPGIPVPAAVDVEDLPGIAAWAGAAEFPDTTLLGLLRAPRVSVLAIDARAYHEVLSGSGSEVPELARLIDGEDRPGAMPALVSSTWRGERAPEVGTEFGLRMGTVDPQVVVVGIVDRFPYLPYPEPFVVVALEDMRQAWGELPVRETTIFLRAPGADAGAVGDALVAMDRTTRLADRHSVAAQVGGDPFALWVDRGLNAIFYLSVAFAVVAALSLLTVTAARRRRELGYLRTLGLTPGQATLITALEQVPPVVVAALAGGVVGGAVALLLAPALDIESFTGSLLPAEIVVDPVAIAALAGVMVLALAIAVVSFVAATRDEDYGRLLKVGEER